MASDQQNNGSNLDMPKSEVKLDFYQTEAVVAVSLYLKNQKDEEVVVEFSEEYLAILGKLPDGTDYLKEIHLARKINPDFSFYKVLSTKIEVTLRKHEGGTWPALEAEKGLKTFLPTYPTSCINKVDWDKFNNEIEDDPTDDPLKSIYDSVDDDTKKAMTKSMQESGGTVLSTDWEKVRKKRVEVYDS